MVVETAVRRAQALVRRQPRDAGEVLKAVRLPAAHYRSKTAADIGEIPRRATG